jgi:hypothetical protein
MSTRLIVTAVFALLSNEALAEEACFKEDALSAIALTGKLEERQLTASSLREFPAVSRGPFYILDLDRPICLEGAFSGSTLKEMRSVHITSVDKEVIRQFRATRGKRVSIRFLNLFEEHTAHHRRPIVGIVDSVTRLPVKRSTR